MTTVLDVLDLADTALTCYNVGSEAFTTGRHWLEGAISQLRKNPDASAEYDMDAHRERLEAKEMSVMEDDMRASV